MRAGWLTIRTCRQRCRRERCRSWRPYSHERLSGRGSGSLTSGPKKMARRALLVLCGGLASCGTTEPEILNLSGSWTIARTLRVEAPFPSLMPIPRLVCDDDGSITITQSGTGLTGSALAQGECADLQQIDHYATSGSGPVTGRIAGATVSFTWNATAGSGPVFNCTYSGTVRVSPISRMNGSVTCGRYGGEWIARK